MKLVKKQDYRASRRRSYPDLLEQIGALIKAVQALKNGEPIPEDAQAVLDQVDEVKSRYPKKSPA